MGAGKGPTAAVYYKYLGNIASLPNSFAYSIEAFHDLIPDDSRVHLCDTYPIS